MLAGYPSGICETHQLKWARPKIWVNLPSKSQVGASMKPPHAASHAFPSVFAMWIWVFHTQTAADSTTVANRRLDADTCTLAESHRSRSRRYARRPLISWLERTAAVLSAAKPTMQMNPNLHSPGLRPPACVRRGPQGGWSSPTRCRTYKRKGVRDEISAHLPTCHPPGLVAQPRARAFLPVYIPTYTHLWASLTLPVRILTSLPPTPSR